MKNALKVLQESVVRYLEEETKGSKFPQFHEYIDGGAHDLEPDKILRLKEEFLQIYKAFVEGMSLTEKTIEVNVPVHETGYSSLLGVPVEKDAREMVAFLINEALDQCELAILAKCGFGKYSASPEEIRKAQGQLRENSETIYLPLPSGSMELKIVAYDSNNNLEHGRVADGLWVPFVAIGLIAYDPKNVVLGFQATMEYKNGNWKLDRLGIDMLYELAEKSSLFQQAYKRFVGKEFDSETKSDQPFNREFIEFIKNSPHFQQALNRVCMRWVN